MSHFGDPEAHRCILKEIHAHPDCGRAQAYMRAAVMGSAGSTGAVSALREVPGLMEQPTHVMHVQLALLSMAARAASGSNRYARERQIALDTIEEVARHGEKRGESPLPPPARAAAAGDSQEPFSRGAGDTVTPDFLFCATSYVNYMSGFTSLWSELFGPSYYIFNHKTGVVENVPQVPPHMYAVNWQTLLTPERQAWCTGLHEMTRDLLRMIITRAMPVEAYFLYVLYASLSLRLVLLETAAELFTWSALYVDIPYCVRQLYASYRTQCEYARLQDVWHSFALFDASFVEDCGKFNLARSAAQGAVFEMPLQSPSSHGPGPSPGHFGRIVSPRHGGGGGAGGGGQPSVSPPSGDAESGGRDQSSSRSATPGGTFMRPVVSWDLVDHAGGSGEGEDDDDDHDDHDDSEENPQFASGGRGLARRNEVYVPMFHTQCHFTWLLQRLFWSMYGRTSLLFSSCVQLELAPSLSGMFVRSADVNSLWASEAPAAAGGPLSEERLSQNGARGPDSHSAAAGSTSPEVPAPAILPPSTPAPGRPERPSSALPAAVPSWMSRSWHRLRDSLAVAGGDHHSARLVSPSPSVSGAAAATAVTAVAVVAAPSVNPLCLPNASDTTPNVDSSLHLSFTPFSAAFTDRPALSKAPQPPLYFRYSWHEALDDANVSDLQRVQEITSSYLLELSFLSVSGCYVLAHAIDVAAMSSHYPATLLMVTDNGTRPGLRNWVDHRYVISAVADDPADRGELDAWVLNFVLPRRRLSATDGEREQQETALLRSVVAGLTGHGTERVAFCQPESLFFVLNGGPYMDQGRVYFVMHLHIGGNPDRSASRAEALLKAEAPTTFGSLEEVRLAWYMSCSCNEALRLAAEIDPSN